MNPIREDTKNSISSNSGKEEVLAGKIHLIIGPMFSGKSTELLRIIRRYNYKRKSTICVAFELDNRYTKAEFVKTHDLIEYPAIKTQRISDIREKLDNYDVIGIDEGQFYPDLVENVESLANNGKTIIISALSGNFKRESFDILAKLIPKCETIQNINAICYNCNEEANFTKRVTKDEEEMVIGGEEMYRPSCRSCFFLNNSNTIRSSNKDC